MFEKGDSSNRQKMSCCYLHQILRQNLCWLLSYHRKKLFLRGFILKSTERAKVLPKNDHSGFHYRPPFERSACFYVTIAWKFRAISKLVL